MKSLNSTTCCNTKLLLESLIIGLARLVKQVLDLYLMFSTRAQLTMTYVIYVKRIHLNCKGYFT